MTRPTVFISYSHKDEKEKNELLIHLGVLRGAGLIDLWSDDRLGAGADWEADINRAMSQAKVAILLVSAHFLNSSFIMNKEVPALLARRKERGLTVFPVIAKSCAWKKVKWLSDMNVRPRDDQPVWRDGGRHADEHLTAIAYEVADLIPSEAADEAVGDRPPQKAGATPPSKLRLFVVTADGGRFETEALPSVLLAHLQSDFLAAWGSPEEQREYVRYGLRLSPHSSPLDTTLSLAEAGITNGTTLYLISEAVSPTSPVGLIVEDKDGRRYVTTVRLDTPVGNLANAFMSNLGDGGEASIELLVGAADAQYRTLRGDVTLYDERVGHGARLRITPAAPNAFKGYTG